MTERLLEKKGLGEMSVVGVMCYNVRREIAKVVYYFEQVA